MGFEPTIIASWVSIALQAFEARGLKAEHLCESANICISDLNNPFKPIPIYKAIKLWLLADEQIQNQCLGLESARFVNFTTFHALGYAVMASANLYDAFSRITAYSNAATNCGHVSLIEKTDRFIVSVRLNPNTPKNIPDGCIDMTLGILRFMCRMLLDERPKIIALEMPRKSLHSPEIFAKVFSKNIQLNCQQYAFHFEKEYFLKPLPTANEMVAKANDKFVEELICNVQNHTVAYHVREQIRTSLNHSKEVTIESISATLAMSERHLQRCLKDEGTTFRLLLDQERKKLAGDMLIETQCSVTNIAHQLGFSDSSNFTRAFKRWFHCKPGDYRADHAPKALPQP